jgi:hypothetical protein
MARIPLGPYAILTPDGRVPHGAVTGSRRISPEDRKQERPMLDLVYLALGIGSFGALMLATRAFGRF